MAFSISTRIDKGQQMSETKEGTRYHVTRSHSGSLLDDLRKASDTDLQKWACDPNCIEMTDADQLLHERLQGKPSPTAANPDSGGKANRLYATEAEVSADAKYIAGDRKSVV